jgi:hypothetical protein
LSWKQCWQRSQAIQIIVWMHNYTAEPYLPKRTTHHLFNTSLSPLLAALGALCLCQDLLIEAQNKCLLLCEAFLTTSDKRKPPLFMLLESFSFSFPVPDATWVLWHPCLFLLSFVCGFYFDSTVVWTHSLVIARQGLPHCSHTSITFFSCILPGPALDYGPPTSASWEGGITGVHHHTWLIKVSYLPCAAGSSWWERSDPKGLKHSYRSYGDAFWRLGLSFFSFGSTGVWTQDLRVARQELYHFSCSPHPPFLL